MLSLKHIHKSFRQKPVLDDVDLDISSTETIGLIGPNGAGKTTLMRIAVGEIQPDSGLVLNRGLKIGYLAQYPHFDDLSIGEYLKSYLPTSQTYLALQDIGMEGSGLNQPADRLSGGEKTKLALAAIVSRQPSPDVLLLDEPTNNLDIDGLDWLKNFINRFRGAVLFTSHDRAFLNEVADKLIVLQDGKAKAYGGNYDFYKQQLEQERLALADTYRAQQKYKRRLLVDIASTKEQARSTEESTHVDTARRYAKKVAKKAKAREHRLERQMASQDWAEKPTKRIHYPWRIGGNVPTQKLILEVDKLSKSFGPKTLFKDLKFEVRGSEHVWLAGANGAGKSTLLEILSSRIKADGGGFRFGEGVSVGYLSQDLLVQHASSSSSGLSFLMNLGISQEPSYKLAMNMHLDPASLKQPIAELSRGQLTKLEFVRLMTSGHQLLILDEPTNHLEIETREEIEAALMAHEGGILVASHDRYFLNTIRIDKTITL